MHERREYRTADRGQSATFYLDRPTREAIRTLASEARTTRSWLVTEAIRQYQAGLRKEPSHERA